MSLSKLSAEDKKASDYLVYAYQLNVPAIIGKGRFGVVQKSLFSDTSIERIKLAQYELKESARAKQSVVLKCFIFNTIEACEAYNNEFKFLWSFKHPNIVACIGRLELETEEGHYGAILLQPVGITLDKFILKIDSFEIDSLAGILCSISSALSYLHQRGIVHGSVQAKHIATNLKREHLQTVKLIDLSIAREITVEEFANSKVNQRAILDEFKPVTISMINKDCFLKDIFDLAKMIRSIAHLNDPRINRPMFEDFEGWSKFMLAIDFGRDKPYNANIIEKMVYRLLFSPLTTNILEMMKIEEEKALQLLNSNQLSPLKNTIYEQRSPSPQYFYTSMTQEELNVQINYLDEIKKEFEVLKSLGK